MTLHRQISGRITAAVRRCCLTLLFALLFFARLASGEEIFFDTDDGVTIHGDIYWAPERFAKAPLILLFHQGGADSRGEYGPLASRLLAEGYNLLGIDQRRGGDRLDGVNRTLAGIGDSVYTYCEAYPDLQGALRFARDYGFTGPVIAWGSSYSAALVFKLAASYPQQIDAVLAFSPASGEPMEGCRPEMFSEKVSQPLLALRPAGEMSVAYVPDQMELFRQHGHQTYVADPGVHGSSMLNAARVEASTEATWTTVLAFLGDSIGNEDD